MATITLEQQLLDNEKAYWTAIKNNDVEAALKLTADPCIVSGSSGVASVDKATFRKMMTGAEWKLRDFKIKDGAQVHVLSDDLAVLAYEVHEDLTVDGKSVSMDAADASTWIRKDGEWVCALHTESLKGDPFGRDRKTS